MKNKYGIGDKVVMTEETMKKFTHIKDDIFIVDKIFKEVEIMWVTFTDKSLSRVEYFEPLANRRKKKIEKIMNNDKS